MFEYTAIFRLTSTDDGALLEVEVDHDGDDSGVPPLGAALLPTRGGVHLEGARAFHEREAADDLLADMGWERVDDWQHNVCRVEPI